MDYQALYEHADSAARTIAEGVEINGWGTGYVYIRLNGRSGFARWAMKEGVASKDPARGIVIVVRDLDDYGNVLLKEQYAGKFAQILNANDVYAHPGVYLT